MCLCVCSISSRKDVIVCFIVHINTCRSLDVCSFTYGSKHYICLPHTIFFCVCVCVVALLSFVTYICIVHFKTYSVYGRHLFRDLFAFSCIFLFSMYVCMSAFQGELLFS